MKNKFWNVKAEGNGRSSIFSAMSAGRRTIRGGRASTSLNSSRTSEKSRPISLLIFRSIRSAGPSIRACQFIRFSRRIRDRLPSELTAPHECCDDHHERAWRESRHAEGSMMMIHKVSSVAIGTTDDMRKAADDMEKLEENLINIYVEKTGARSTRSRKRSTPRRSSLQKRLWSLVWLRD